MTTSGFRGRNSFKAGVCNTPHPIFFDFCPALYKGKERRKKKRKAYRGGERGKRELGRPVPANPTQMTFPFSATTSAKVGTDQKLLSRWSSPCHPCHRKTSRKPPIEALKFYGIAVSIGHDFVSFRWHRHLGFVLHLALCDFWLSTAVGDIVLPLIVCWRIHNFESSIQCHRCAWKVTTTTTIRLSVAWPFIFELPVAVGWISVTVDRQGHFDNFAL